MPTWAYQARDRSGQRVSGTREAATQKAALESLREIGLYVTQLKPTKGPSNPTALSAPSATATVGAVTTAANSAAATQTEPPPSVPVMASHRQTSGQPHLGHSGEHLEFRPTAQMAPPQQPALQRSEGPDTWQPDQRKEGAEPASAGADMWARSSAKELSLYFSQMHAMLNAGTVLSQALATMAQSAPSAALRRASADMSRSTALGSLWSSEMKRYPGLFSELMIAMISAGERGGFLDRMCLRLSQYSERDYHIQQTIKRETWYPKLLVFASILIPSLPPVVVAWFKGENLGQALLVWLLSVSGPLLLIGALWGLWKMAHFLSPITGRTGSPRHMIDSLKLVIPIAGKTVRALATAKFCRALAALSSAGMGLHKTIELSADSCGNAAIAASARGVLPLLDKGASLSEALAQTGQLPPVALQMLRTAEQSGDLDRQLEKVADFLEQDAETTIKQSLVVLGIGVLLLIAIRIALQVIGFYTGYFDSIFSQADGV